MGVTDQNEPFSLYFWLEEFQDSDDWPAVMRTARELLHLLPDNPEGLRFLAEAYFRIGKTVEAYSTALRLIEVNPLSIDGFWILSDLAAQANDPERCADFIEKAARLIPDSDTIWVEVAKANFALQRAGRCLIAADQGLRVNPHNIRLWIFKVISLISLKRQQGAKIAASRLISLGVDTEVLRDTAKELGISSASLSKILQVAQGAEVEMTLPTKSSSKRADAALNLGLLALSDVTSQAQPLTPRQFALQLEAARSKADHDEDEAAATDDQEPSFAEGEDSTESDPQTAEVVYYAYSGYRVQGPYTLAGLRELIADGTLDSKSAFVRREEDSSWSRCEEFLELADLIAE